MHLRCAASIVYYLGLIEETFFLIKDVTWRKIPLQSRALFTIEFSILIVSVIKHLFNCLSLYKQGKKINKDLFDI